MQKHAVVVCALAAVSGASMAQSSVTLFGVVDATVQHASQAGASANRLLGAGGNQFSRLGFRGTEDLGGGLAAGFVLDMGLNVDTGTGAPTSANNQVNLPATGTTFNRRSTVSLSSRELGEIRLGRDFVPTYWNITVFDPFGTAGAGSAANLAQGSLTRVSTVVTGLRASNSVGYFLPAMNGFYGQAMYAMGENVSPAPAGTRNDGNYAGARLGYAAGPLNVAAAYGTTSLASGDVSTGNLGASYTVGSFKFMAQFYRDAKERAAAPSRSRGWLVGAQIELGQGYFPVSYSQVQDNSAAERKAAQIAVGYVHNLSKRTAVYTTYSRIQNRNGAAVSGGGVPGVVNANWTGLDLGIRHIF
ncbi:porin [Variovorax arabinosiphilus]|uniref:porin n=1 Tax=Variovorax arabinosiphilus TaxID=3053498 RepID=UPI002577E43F|nr:MULTISPECIES: porin [unclassified Variovorax]MDM0120743.1 porin [Variovorax sp. J2L1-78]MDM0127345.1 porin [Variovorax sp. J2L1-63]MDM0236123.1 porin [Variovorax sp. J2R1-6]